MSKMGKFAAAAVSVPKSQTFRMNVPTNEATPAPPLGPSLGSKGVNIKKFCKEFNTRTEHFKPGQPLPIDLTIHPDRSYEFKIYWPTQSYLIKQAAGISKGSGYRGWEWVGAINLKQVYHIAVCKKNDPRMKRVPLEEMCKDIIKEADHMGVAVVKH